MKKIIISGLAGILMILPALVPSVSRAQSEKVIIEKYLQKLTKVPVGDIVHKYKMTAVYTNRDLYGNFTGKIKVTGEYTKSIENGLVHWNNIFISNSSNYSEPFSAGTKQEYMENLTYVPSPKMLAAESFKNFPATTDAVFARNLVWDMMAIENFAWDFTDSLKLNKTYRVPQNDKTFNMADSPLNCSIWQMTPGKDPELC